MVDRSLRHGFTVVELLVVIGIISVLLGLLLPAVVRVRDAANRTSCNNNLHQIGLALHNYHEVHHSFPPGTSYIGGADPYPFMSWNTRLLPFLEQGSLWEDTLRAFEQQRNFLNNPPHIGLSLVISVFACPADPRTLAPRVLARVTVAFTAYLGVEGTDQFHHDGALYLDSHIRFSDITDGASNTLLVGERPPSADGILGWWYAGVGQSNDGSADMVLGAQERNVSYHGAGCPPGPYQFGPGRASNQCDTFHFWSPHLGSGANFLFADGAVHFLPYSAASVVPALATRSGQETVALPD